MTAAPKLQLLVIRSADVERAAGFYAALGFHFSPQQQGNGPRHYAAQANGVVLELYPLKSGAAASNIRLGFEVDSVDLVTERLTRLGAVCLERPHVPEDSQGARCAVVKDFDGNAVELMER
jgi:hypothetical protein